MRRRINRKQKELFYVELRIAGKVPLFVRPVFMEKIVSSLSWCCDKRGLRIYDYTIMPDSIILIANTAWGSLQEVLLSFRGFTSKAIMLMLRSGKSNLETAWMIPVFQEYGPAGKPEGAHIWEEEILMRSLFEQDEIDQCAVNIHQRAVEMGWVEKPEHYRYCSANPGHPLDGWVVEATDPWS